MRRRTSQNSQRSLSQSDFSYNMDENNTSGREQQQISFDSTDTGAFGQAANTSGKGKHQRKSKGCKCRGDCGKKRCGCNSINQKCTVNCSCTDKCKNRDTTATNQHNGSDEEKLVDAVIKEEDENEKSSDGSDAENEFKSPRKQLKMNNSKDSNVVDETFLTTKSNINASTFLTPKMAR